MLHPVADLCFNAVSVTTSARPRMDLDVNDHSISHVTQMAEQDDYNQGSPFCVSVNILQPEVCRQVYNFYVRG